MIGEETPEASRAKASGIGLVLGAGFAQLTGRRGDAALDSRPRPD